MEFGVHLPLIALGHERPDLAGYVRDAQALGFSYVCANDHLRYSRPWLDGPTALAAVLEAAGDMTLATTVILPVIRGAVQTAAAINALQALAPGRVVCGVGPGSSRADYAAAGIPFAERWRRFDAAIATLRTETTAPIWVASWGSSAGMRRVRRLGDGWIASAYNTPPDVFAAARPALPNALATMWTYVTGSRRAADRIRNDVLAPLVNRAPETLQNLCIGSAADCAERVDAYRRAGVERIFIWPLADERAQLERFQNAVSGPARRT